MQGKELNKTLRSMRLKIDHEPCIPKHRTANMKGQRIKQAIDRLTFREIN